MSPTDPAKRWGATTSAVIDQISQCRADFPHRGRPICVRSPSLRSTHRSSRQCGRDQQQIVEVTLYKGGVTDRLQQPAIPGISQAGQKTNRIKRVTKPPHSRAEITRPAQPASTSLKKENGHVGKLDTGR